MDLFIFLFIFFATGALLGALWRWSDWLLFLIVGAVSFFGYLHTVELPKWESISYDFGSLLWFLINYGVGFALVATAGAAGAFAGLFAAKKLDRRKSPPKLASHKNCQ